MRRTLLLLMLLSLMGLGAWQLAGENDWLAGARPAPAPGASAPEASAAPASEAKPATLPKIRALVGILRASDGRLSHAHILTQGRIDKYGMGDAVPPDEAIVVEIQDRYVDLEKDGARERLTLQDLTDEEKFLYTPGINLDDVEDVVGDLTVPETPEGKKAVEMWGDPYAECDRMKDDAQADDCRVKKDEQMNAAVEACDVYETAAEHEACLYKAYGVKASPEEIKQYMDEQQKKREASGKSKKPRERKRSEQADDN